MVNLIPIDIIVIIHHNFKNYLWINNLYKLYLGSNKN